MIILYQPVMSRASPSRRAVQIFDRPASRLFSVNCDMFRVA